MILFTLFC